uniref:Transmembrane protein n=1 Tax=Myotis myotis TaxID=51298 RepID=A0A7J7WHN9_MYOMY|nr:hypothetical protein mMyoMyo1_012055 [Myotis myotis]
MNAGRGPPYLNLSVCVLIFPTLPRSPLPLLCVCASTSPSSSVLSVFSLPSGIFIFPLICLSILRSLGVYFRLHLTPYLFLFAPISLSAPVSPPPILFSFSSLLACVTTFLPVCLPHPACVSLHSFPRRSPDSSLPKPKGTLVLNLDGLRCGEKLHSQRFRQPPVWSFTPPPPPLSTFSTCCMLGVGGRGMPTTRGGPLGANSTQEATPAAAVPQRKDGKRQKLFLLRGRGTLFLTLRWFLFPPLLIYSVVSGGWGEGGLGRELSEVLI